MQRIDRDRSSEMRRGVDGTFFNHFVVKQKSWGILRFVRREDQGNTVIGNEQITIPESIAGPFVKNHRTIIGIWTDVHR